MTQQPINTANEALVLEVVEWLETAAHNTDLARIARSISERKPRFVGFDLITHFTAGEITGLEYVVKHPVKDFQKAVGLTDQDMHLLKEFLATTPSPTIRISFVVSEEHEELLCLSQLNYVPRGCTEEASNELLGVVRKIFAVCPVAEDCVFEIEDRGKRDNVKGKEESGEPS